MFFISVLCLSFELIEPYKYELYLFLTLLVCYFVFYNQVDFIPNCNKHDIKNYALFYLLSILNFLGHSYLFSPAWILQVEGAGSWRPQSWTGSLKTFGACPFKAEVIKMLKTFFYPLSIGLKIQPQPIFLEDICFLLTVRSFHCKSKIFYHCNNKKIQLF